MGTTSAPQLGLPLYNAKDPSIADGKVPIQAMIEKIELFSTTDRYAQPYDITKVVVELEITESIHSLAVVGFMTIADEYNFFQDARIHGQEKIRIKIRRFSVSDSSYVSIIEKDFIVTNIKNFDRLENSLMFTLEFAASHVIKDKTTRISRAYGYTNITNVPQGDIARSAEAFNAWKQKYSEKTIEYGDIFEKTNETPPDSFVGMSSAGPYMVEYPELFIYDILRRDLEMNVDDVWLYGYSTALASPKPSAEKMKVIIPNWRPFQVIRWLLRNTFSTEHNYVGQPWFCYDTFIAGIRIEPYSMLVKKYPYGSGGINTVNNELFTTGRTTKEIPEKYIYNPLYQARPESKDYFIKMHQKIFEISLGTSFDSLDRSANGAYASMENYVDIFSKWVLPNPAYPIEKTLLKYDDHIIPGKDTLSSHFKPYSSATLDLIDLNKTNYTYFIAYNSALHGTVEETFPYNKAFAFAGTSGGGGGLPYFTGGQGPSISPGSYNGINPTPGGMSDDVMATSQYNRTVSALGLSSAEWGIYRKSVAELESSGSGGYSAVGGSGNAYFGAYQMGTPAREDAARILGIPEPSTQQFLADEDLQEQMVDAYTYANHTYMSSNSAYLALPPQEKLAILGYAHSTGHGAAKNYLNTGNIHSDGWGTKSIKYYNSVMGNLQTSSSLVPSEETDNTTHTTEEKEADNNSSTPIPTEQDVISGITGNTGEATSRAMALRGGTLSNGCAAYASSMLQLQGFDVESEVGAQRLADQLVAKGWERVPLGQQRPGDMAVTADHGQGAPGADHVYIVTGVDPNNPDQMTIVDNQFPSGGTRSASGGGKTPTEYFIRPPYGIEQSDRPVPPPYMPGQTPSLMPTIDPSGLGKLGRTGDMLRRNIAFMSHTMKILGDLKINPGMVVYIEIPKTIDPEMLGQIEGMKEKTGLIDEYLSGQYFVTECTHSFREKTFYSYVTINKDSSALDLETEQGLAASNQIIVDTEQEQQQS